ncbi:hypothetical protein D3C75_1131490 [compost metagenome]
MEVTVDTPWQDQAGEAAGETGYPVGATGQYRAQTHDAPAAELIGEIAINGLTDGIRPQHDGRCPAQGFFGKTKLSLNAGDGKTEGLSPGIEE